MGPSLMLRHQKRVARRTNAPHDTALLQFRKRFTHPNQALRDTTVLLRHRKRVTRQTNLPLHLNRSTWQTDINRSNSLVPRPKKIERPTIAQHLSLLLHLPKRTRYPMNVRYDNLLFRRQRRVTPPVISDHMKLQSTVSVSI